MISNFTRDNSFFQSLSENNSDITYKDFDDDLNNLINYLNRKVVSSINNIGFNSYNGVIDNINYIIKNIGNGDIVFDSLKDTNYLDNSIKLTKFTDLRSYTLLFVNNNYDLHKYKKIYSNINGIPSSRTDLVVKDGIFSGILNYNYSIPISGNNFYNRTITSNKIAPNSINSNHINDDGIKYLINNIKIESKNIIDRSLNSNNFSDYSITYEKLNDVIKNIRNLPTTNISYLDNCIYDYQIKDNSLDFRLLNLPNGTFDKSVIPNYSAKISLPDIDNPEKIDTYQLAVYSISNAYELKTYEEPQPDNIYINPDYIEYEKEYILSNSLYVENSLLRDSLYRGSEVLSNGVTINAFKWSEENPTHSFKWLFENVFRISSRTRDNSRIINKLNSNLPIYLETLQKVDYYKTRSEYYNNLLKTTPMNIYTPVPPIKYQRLEPVPNTKSYYLSRTQSCIKSKHLRTGTFSFSNFLDRNTYNNVSSNKFINKSRLSPELRAKLNLVK